MHHPKIVVCNPIGVDEAV